MGFSSTVAANQKNHRSHEAYKSVFKHEKNYTTIGPAEGIKVKEADFRLFYGCIDRASVCGVGEVEL